MTPQQQNVIEQGHWFKNRSAYFKKLFINAGQNALAKSSAIIIFAR